METSINRIWFQRAKGRTQYVSRHALEFDRDWNPKGSYSCGPLCSNNRYPPSNLVVRSPRKKRWVIVPYTKELVGHAMYVSIWLDVLIKNITISFKACSSWTGNDSIRSMLPRVEHSRCAPLWNIRQWGKAMLDSHLPEGIDPDSQGQNPYSRPWDDAIEMYILRIMNRRWIGNQASRSGRVTALRPKLKMSIPDWYEHFLNLEDDMYLVESYCL